MTTALKISDAATLAIHAVSALARSGLDEPVKILQLARILKASEAHLGKVMHRLAQAKIVLSKRGPLGGFTLNPEAQKVTLLEIYEMFDGPIGHDTCLIGYASCPFGGCVLGNALDEISSTLRRALGDKRIADLITP